MEKIDNSDSSNESSLLQRKLQADPQFSAEDKYVLKKLLEFKTRPKVILAIMKSTSLSLTESDLVKLYKKINNAPSPRGLERYTPERMLVGPDFIYHSSYYVAIFEMFLSIYKSTPLTHVMAYAHYLENTEQDIDSAIIQFSNAYKLCQWLAVGEYTMTTCRECELRYLHYSFTPLVKDGCPCCNIIKKRIKENSTSKSSTTINLRPKESKIL